MILVGILPGLWNSVYNTKSLHFLLYNAWSSFTCDTPELFIDTVID